MNNSHYPKGPGNVTVSKDISSQASDFSSYSNNSGKDDKVGHFCISLLQKLLGVLWNSKMNEGAVPKYSKLYCPASVYCSWTIMLLELYIYLDAIQPSLI